MGWPISILFLVIIAIITVLIPRISEGKKQETYNRYLRNGDWFEIPDNDEGIYDLLVNLHPTDYITFPNKLPTLLETVLQKGIVYVGDIYIKKEDYNNFSIISDDKGNLWSIIECGYPNISFLVYSIDGNDIEYINSKDVDLG